MRPARTLPILGLILALSTPACGKEPSSQELAGTYIPVLVENDLTNRSDVTVRMVAANGASSLLGGASPGRTRQLRYTDRMFSGNYRLTAETGDGRVIESRPFTLFRGAAVIWSLQRNVLRVTSVDALEDPGAEPYGGAP
ncbi:MAG: hypothetical protein P8177_10085 [Gemmatimonadota bacterium]